MVYKIKSLLKHLKVWWYDSEWIVLPEIPNTATGSWEYVITEHFLFETVSNYVSKNGEDAFSIYELNDDTQDKIINILHFYHVRKKEKELRIEKLWDKVHNIRDTYFAPWGKFYKRCHYHKTSQVECNALMQLAIELDNELYEETQEMLHLCVIVR